MIFLGGVYSSYDVTQMSSHIYQVELRGACQATRIAELPAPMKNVATCFCCHDNKEFLYIFGDQGFSFRLNMATRKWNVVPCPRDSLDIANLDSIQVIQDNIFLISEGQLCRYKSSISWALKEDPGWEIIIDRGFPSGKHCVVGYQIYTYSSNNDLLSCWDMPTGQLTTVELDDDDKKQLDKSIEMVGIGYKYIFFTGHHLSQDKTSVVEYDLSKNRTVIAGYIDKCPQIHKAIVVWHNL